MLKSLLATANDSILLLMGVVLVIVFFLNGVEKMLGRFAGYGFTRTKNFFTSVMQGRECTSQFLVKGMHGSLLNPTTAPARRAGM